MNDSNRLCKPVPIVSVIPGVLSNILAGLKIVDDEDGKKIIIHKRVECVVCGDAGEPHIICSQCRHRKYNRLS